LLGCSAARLLGYSAARLVGRSAARLLGCSAGCPRVGAWLLGSGGAVALASCELGTVTVPKTQPSIVVHAVLNANAASQVILVERTLSGAIPVHDTTFNAADPIVSDGGIPVSGARVEIIDSAGFVSHAVEDITTSTNGQGAGVYHVSLSTGVRLGMRYQLHIVTAEGEEVTAFTRVPFPEVASTGALTRTFNRDRDSIVVTWKRAAAARAYALRVESPFGPFFLFTDSLRFRMNGDLRNLFASDIPRVFIPGFRQDVIIAAVDSNFFDYYRTNNDPFTGSGIISRLNGALGMFGSMVTLNSGTLTVVADQTEPIEGRFRVTAATGDAASFVSTVNLYIESPPAPGAAQPTAALSGRYTLGGPNARSDGVIGRLSGTTVSFALLANQLAGDTVDVFTGTLEGTTLSGKYKRRTGEVVFVKQ
jgi:hypothetical protein